jgi:hypothetical protein
MLKTKPVRSEKHRRFIASLPCCVTGREGSTQAAHVRIGTLCGLGLKPSDEFCVPLSVAMHERQHRMGERRFWADPDIAIQLAKALHAVTGNYEAGEKLVRNFREAYFPWGW